MSAQPILGARAMVASALSAAADWLVEPADLATTSEPHGTSLTERPVVAVVGLAPRSGATTVARALGVELAARDPAGACAVTAGWGGGSVPLGLPASGRLARKLGAVAGARTKTCGRLCLVDCPDRAALAGALLYLAPLVLDVAEPGEASSAAALADEVVLVGTPPLEPALAAVMSESLTRVGPEPQILLNRALDDDGPWSGRASLELPESRLGAQLALAGREPRGELGRAVSALADRARRRP